MGGGHGDGHSTSYKGFTMHHPKRWHVVTGKGMCALMWFWVLYRAKQDGPVVLGWRHPWEGHGHGHVHENEEVFPRAAPETKWGEASDILLWPKWGEASDILLWWPIGPLGFSLRNSVYNFKSRT